MSDRRGVKAAAVQLNVVLEDEDATAGKVCDWIDRVAADGADIVIFPELILAAGYSLGENFRQIAETPDGPHMTQVRDGARRNEVNVVVGFAESGPGDAVYNSAALIGRDGGIVGVYRKTHIFTATESFFEPGSLLPVFAVDFGRVAIPICYDLEFPEPARVLCLDGAEMLLSMAAHWEGSGTVGTPENFIRTIYSARALENRVPVVLCNRVGYDPGLGDRFIGLSRIVDSDGEVVAAMPGDSEGAISAVIDLEEQRRKRESYDYLANRHPSLYVSLGTPNRIDGWTPDRS